MNEQLPNSNEEEDWRTDVSTEAKPTLKVQDGEKINFVFNNEGKKNLHPDFGESIVFDVTKDEDEMRWFVSPNNYDLLGQIKALGALKELAATVSRVGSTKSNTRYTIVATEA